MHNHRLTDLSVVEFVRAVASAEQPESAGGSVAALTGAASAALLALVCDMHQRHSPGALGALRHIAENLQRQLLELVDHDAAAFRALVESERGSNTRLAARPRVVTVPLEIGRACSEIPEVARALETYVRGASMPPDIGAARRIAIAAGRSALDIAEFNLRLVGDQGIRDDLRTEIERLPRPEP
jgi:formiminotetrahydrofolate cyclodeaminase